MSKNDKIQMPSSGAGITRYFDDYKSKIELKPAHVVILVIIVILVVVFLHTQSGFLG
ncbi:preprotein translocase subunit Sec61beta [Candidatus Woesearchaeota archaeon]|nr:preprotein translocase subunit Sec61beta [Candidatus Woesearchaeota archaeon]